MSFIGPDTGEVEAYPSYELHELAGIVQLQYAGNVDTGIADDPARLDFTLREADRGDVYSAFWSNDAAMLLYRIDAYGRVSDISSGVLVAAQDSILEFSYDGITEVHTIEPTRMVGVHQGDSEMCCSIGDPQHLGLVLAIVLLPRRRRRKLRA
jgi:hypothetical protein